MAISVPQIILLALLFLLLVWPYARIFRKAGMSPWLSLLMIVPLVNFITLWYLALAEWPALKKPTLALVDPRDESRT